MKQLRILLSCFALAALVLAAPNGFPSARVKANPNAACNLSWELVPGPSFPGKSPSLQIIAHSASNDVWAVGFLDEGAPGEYLYHPLILHWDGSGWSRVAAPNLGTYLYGLLGVAAISQTDAWAVGYYRDGADRGLILHWDGTTWSNVLIPEEWGMILFDTDHAAADYVWAVGNRDKSAVLLFWNGIEWLNRSDQIGALGFIGLNKVDARGADDVYAAGRLYEGNLLYAGIAHWDGTEWKIITKINIMDPSAPYSDAGDYISGMEIFSPNEIWLSLNHLGASHVIRSHRLLHWDGSAWETIDEGIGTTQDMTQAVPNLVYAVFRLIELGRAGYWNGTIWDEMNLPLPKGDAEPFGGIESISEQEAWVVGDEYNVPNKNQPYLAHGTSPCAVPERPTLLLPAKNQTIQNANPNLKWVFTPGANSFEVILKQIKTPAIPLQAAVTHSKFKPAEPLIQGATYKWRVRACNNNGCGDWTRARTFTIAE